MNTLQIVCSYQQRFGPRGDTGYEVCEDEKYRPGKPCIVYSFGSLFMFGFEEDLIKYHQCEVHTYDPSVPIADHVIPKGVKFHLVGLGDNVTTNSEGWKMQTFSDIRRTLKTIDILKIDIEGGEWVSLAHALQSGELRFVKQIQIELHFWGQQRVGMPLVRKLTVLKQLYEQGFRIFMHERFWTDECERKMRPPHPNITLCVILSFVNTKYQPY
ncbi:probable methyltransferase-like protein 24 [Mercenaria mercenaria]|uniref:probable methyltransferase-like protein 24 n=1 Tax=Mercenaria mercenaria TaxID=6596 RepID=UPI00234FAF47|nr:probable methyltransferase-like protein 24 [Mercenaria mercenaria]